MRQIVFILIILMLAISETSHSTQNMSRTVLDLNGKWEFEQTKEAFPPTQFTRIIPVPGLIDLAQPKVEQYERYFCGTQEPRYNWYRHRFRIGADLKGKYTVLTIRKSMFNTQIILNGHDMGTFMECNTPIDCNLTEFINFDGENELLIRVGERAWLPKQAATGVDREKYTDIPGIWDDVFITFTGPFRVERSLILPDLKKSKVTAKIMIENHANIITRDMYLADFDGEVSVYIRERKTGTRVTDEISRKINVQCLQRRSVEFILQMKNPHPWSPEDPFLYEVIISVVAQGILSDQMPIKFGMRDFKAVGKMFHLNGKQYRLLGSTINLVRFFEDPERTALPWDRAWVKKLFIDIPKSLRWNAFRMCIGLAPNFWYDLADEYGILLQNEWPMWQVRGWNEQIRKEYTDWIWADGSHPSIAIWDAMNELKHEFIGNVLIPDLKLLDPTRIWDAGYMTSEDMVLNDMDEPHYYALGFGWWTSEEELTKNRQKYRFGNLFRKEGFSHSRFEGVPQVLNEYGWLWLNRDGTPGIRTKGYFGPLDTPPRRKNYEYYDEDGKPAYPDRLGNYEYFLGKNSTVAERREFQAYMMGIETEAIRSSRDLAGVLSFCYLSNNRGYTGDWFINAIKDLEPGPTLRWMYHYFSPFAIFFDVEDSRYIKNPHYFSPGKTYSINLLGVNDTKSTKSGRINLKMLDKEGTIVFTGTDSIIVEALWQTPLPLQVKMPEKNGCYLLLSELYNSDERTPPQISRRYIRVGASLDKNFYEYPIDLPPFWPTN